MADRIGNIRAQRVSLGQIFTVELLPFQIRQGLSTVQFRLQFLAGTAGGFACHQCLAAAGGIAGIRRDPCVVPLIHNIVTM